MNSTPTGATAGVDLDKPCPYCGKRDGTHDKAYPHPRRAQPRVAEQADSITYTVDGEVMSPLEYINYLHEQLAARQAAPAPATDQPSAGRVDEREGMEGLRPYEFMVSGQSFRWYLKRDVDALLSARASLTPTAPQAATTASASTIKTWQERTHEDKWCQPTTAYMEAEIADLRAALARAPLPAQAGEWHAPGMGEVHYRDHSLMIDCRRAVDDPEQDYIADDDLAKRVCAALNSATCQTGAVDVARDAARWREALMHVGGAYCSEGARFTLRYLPAVPESDIMKGSIAEHFTAAIDRAAMSRTNTVLRQENKSSGGSNK